MKTVHKRNREGVFKTHRNKKSIEKGMLEKWIWVQSALGSFNKHDLRQKYKRT